MRDIVLPRTDAGVGIQLLVTAMVVVALLWVVRDRDVRILVIGLATVAFAFFGLRALH